MLQVIDLKCPQALEQPDPSSSNTDNFGGGDAEVEINVDALDQRTFTELDRYVKEKVLARSTGEDME